MSKIKKIPPYQQALAWATEYNKQLRSDSPRFNRSVMILDEDGSSMYFRFAFAVRKKIEKEKYICVFTEHHSFHVFPEGDLLRVMQHQCEIGIEDSDLVETTHEKIL